MSFWPFERSRTRGRPVTLYFFRYGSLPSAYFAYTDAEHAILKEDITYKPIPIDRDAVTASGSLDKTSLEIQTPQNVELAELFRAYPPNQVITLVISQGHIDDPSDEFVTVWHGRVLSCARESSKAKYTCEPIATSLRRAGLRRNYQIGCPHALYGSECRANQIAATTAHAVVFVAGSEVTLPDGWHAPHTAAQYVGGMVAWTRADGFSELRTILRVSPGQTVVLMAGASRGLEAGMSVNVTLGCNHQMTDCQALHNNILNYGGDAWIPLKSPMGTVNNYY